MADAAQGPGGGLAPHLRINGGRAAEAADFYVAALGAAEQVRMPADDGRRLIHVQLLVNGGSLLLADDFPEFRGGAAAPAPAGVTLHLQVDDADAWIARAAAAGASVTMPAADMFWGDRYGQVTDPFGHVWAFGSALAG